MIPIRDNSNIRRQPLAVYGLIGVNLALFLWEIKLGFAGQLSEVAYRWGIVPERISAVATDALSTANPAAWFAFLMVSASIIPALFLHSSYTQILGNSIFLFVFGQRVEALLGSGRFLLFYLGCGILTSLVQILVEPARSHLLIGSNGAVAAVLGAYLLNFPKAKIETILPLVVVFIPIELPALFYLFWWFIQQAFYGIGKLEISGEVNSLNLGYLAHGIGLVFGAVGIYGLQKCDRHSSAEYRSQKPSEVRDK